MGTTTLLAAGCGSDHSPEELHDALLTEFEDAVLAEDQTETGVYEELTTVQESEALRSSVELDKPECANTASEWNELEEVRSANAAVGVYGREGEYITHILLDASSDTAQEALDARPPEECQEYEATNADGSVSSYSVSDLDLSDVGSGSYAFLVETEAQDTTVLMYSLVYEGDGYLGMTTVLGTEASEDTLVNFTETALEHEASVLG
ncbi:hypothetical protein J4H86_16815 [Spiractinospora alimapuensis]|uniref:hypothetical protein n=1 Tax=Spiractinospora alimapuensis TaxID=2820884 RepID=UPI001F462662|nr:hypothetical protein [Spiractinospora alimapuensis]QVQ50557.1 hypothetical protein J4H86_16815 [Spiractinospora alimapuensis]